ncbi:hypothetical protein OIU76_013341 [Salix suchowensis]|nr:hypothetical protein OIU76_013341 [Salix suchowensis]
MEKKSETAEEWTNRNPPEIISKELPSGPKAVLVPQGSPNLRSVAADSIEGQSPLHQYLNLFHENYVEYAHKDHVNRRSGDAFCWQVAKVYFELKHHAPQLKRIIDDQHDRFDEAQGKLSKVRKKQSGLEDRINHAMLQHNLLEQRLHCLKNLAGAHKKPLSKAEREFKSDTHHFTGAELDSLRTSIDTLKARLRRLSQSSKGDVANQQTKKVRRNYVLYAQISKLKSSLAKLSLLNGIGGTIVLGSQCKNEECIQLLPGAFPNYTGSWVHKLKLLIFFSTRSGRCFGQELLHSAVKQIQSELFTRVFELKSSLC